MKIRVDEMEQDKYEPFQGPLFADAPWLVLPHICSVMTALELVAALAVVMQIEVLIA